MPTLAPHRTATSLWWLALTLGLVDVVIGLAVLAWPDETVVVLAVLFGLRFLVGGLLRLARSVFASDHATAGVRVATAVVGGLFVFVGLLCLQNVMQTVAILVVLVGLSLLVGGVLDLVAVLIRGPADGFGRRTVWDALAGVASTVAGFLVLLFPEASVSALATLLGVSFLVVGVLSVVVAFRARATDGAA
jgi:uncharacterized membrane protein HdeD (DUF308 family)